jgi:PASTA domain
MAREAQAIRVAAQADVRAVARVDYGRGRHLVVERRERRGKSAEPTATTTASPEVALDPAGDMVATWMRDPFGWFIQAAARPAGGDWGRPADLSLSPTVVVPDVIEFSKTFAAREVTAEGLIPKFTGATTAQSSYVVSETPAAGTEVDRGATITMRLRPGTPP